MSPFQNLLKNNSREDSAMTQEHEYTDQLNRIEKSRNKTTSQHISDKGTTTI